jgi:uncharacterized protein (TIGR03083 family)
MGDAGEARKLVSLLRETAASLDAQVGELDGDALSGQSYCSEWSIAQVLSHLGSGAEIFAKVFAAAAAGEPAPGHEAFGPIWDDWNARAPEEQASGYLEANAALLDQVDAYDDDTLEKISLEIFGATRGAAELLRMRLNEQVLHSWDVAVAADPAADLFADAVPEVLGALTQVVGWAGKPPADSNLSVAVHTADPEGDLVLTVGERAELRQATEDDAGAGDAGARLELPAAALIRLVYGRLDPMHTPEGVVADGVELDDLRAVFPGL